MSDTLPIIATASWWKRPAAEGARSMIVVPLGAATLIGGMTTFGFDLPYPTRGEWNMHIQSSELQLAYNEQISIEAIIVALELQRESRQRSIHAAEEILQDTSISQLIRQRLMDDIDMDTDRIAEIDARITRLRSIADAGNV